jgi:glucosyl-3-phosphoglycerate phosphatase
VTVAGGDTTRIGGPAERTDSTGRQIILWRHGLTDWNKEGRFQGQTNVPLNATGMEQAAGMARVLARRPPDAIIASDLDRAKTTADALAQLTGLPVTLDKGLRETYAGSWQGLTDTEIEEKFPGKLAEWRRGELRQRGGDGELDTEVAERAVKAIMRGLEGIPPGGRLMVVTHGGAARVALGRMLGLAEDQWGALGSLSNCCWSVLGEHHRGWRLLEHNAGTLLEPAIGDDE